MAEGRGAAVHISSAIVLVRPDRVPAVTEAINALPDTEVWHGEAGKLVVVLEGPTSRAVGDRLAGIALIDGVISANLVYEQVETVESLGEVS